jgi:NADH:ubiquinone oxidoreductase subunit 2 (subunit N)
VIATAISLTYYLRVLLAMWTRAEPTALRPALAGGSPPFDPLLASGVFASVVVTVGSFFFVQPLIDLARDAASSLPL